jgi:two-component system, OmpR family, sensor histidine kinase CiaH
MKNILRPFVGWVTNLKNNAFFRAKLKLTFFYIATLLIVIIVFSIMLYTLFVNNIASNFEFEEESYSEVETNSQYIILNNAISRLKLVLIITDIGIILIISGLGYFLAGKTLQPIKKSLEEQKRFVSDSAHELRTPLSIMKTGIETMDIGKNQTLKDYKELNGELLEEVDKLINMSNDLLFLARSDSVKPEKNHDKINLSSICSNQIKSIKTYAYDKGVSLNEDIKKALYIIGNADQINRLVANLLKNAIDYNKKNGEVLLSLKKYKHNIILTIKDTGIGIALNDQRRIFERFFKVDKARSIYEGGSGLGLSIVKEIVDFHKGTIKISSEPSKGTEVIVSFNSINNLL